MRIARSASVAALFSGLILGFESSAAAQPLQLSEVGKSLRGFVIDGESAGDRAANVGSGDFNGDGITDIIIGAPYDDGAAFSSGRCFVVFGKIGQEPVNLADFAQGQGGFVIEGEGLGHNAGGRVSGVGDMNGDGFDDLVLSASAALFSAPNSGRCYVVFGKADTSKVSLSSVAAGIGGFAIDGEFTSDFAGECRPAGDINGDGIDDVVIGVPYSDANGTESGRSYVVFGKLNTAPVDLFDIARGLGGGFAIDGERQGDNSGWSVWGAGYVNGDGFADLIIGSYYGGQSGRSYVVFGKAGAAKIQLADVAQGIGGFAINGERSNGYAGFSVCGAGDMNGDGLDDVALTGAFGRAYVVFGKNGTGAVHLDDVVQGLGGFVIREEPGAFFAANIRSAGDLNGDGIRDLLAGNRFANSDAGRIYAILGKSNTEAVQLSIVNGIGGFALDGEKASDQAGASLDTAGDTNGDGLADIVIGARGADFNGENSGRSYVVFSPETPPLAAPPDLPPKATYLRRTRRGDGPGGKIVPPTMFENARVTIDFSDDDFGIGPVSASKETVVLRRHKGGIANLLTERDIANVAWRIVTNRTGFAHADLTFKYLDHEIAAMEGEESQLAVYRSAALTGPWTRLPTQIDAAKNEAKVRVTKFGFFALGNPEGFTPFVQSYTAAGGMAHGFTGAAVPGFGGRTDLTQHGLCLTVDGPGDNFIIWTSPERMLELFDGAILRARLQVNTAQIIPDAIPLFFCVYDNYNSNGLGNNFNGSIWVLDVDGGAQGISRPQGRSLFDIYIAPNSINTPQWKSGAFTPAADLENDIRVLYKIIDANAGLLTDADFGTICVAQTEIQTFMRADLPAFTTVYNPPISSSTHFPETFFEAGIGGLGTIDDSTNTARYMLTTVGDVRKTLGPYDSTQPDLNSQLFPVIWEGESLYRIRSSVRAESSEADPIDILLLAIDTATIELGTMQYSIRGAPGSAMDRVASPKLAAAEYEAYFFGHNSTLSVAPNANRLRPQLIFFNLSNVAGDGTGADATFVQSLEVDRFDALPR